MLKQCVLLCCLIALANSQGPTSSQEGQEGQDKAFAVASREYFTLRNIAFPEHKLSDNEDVGSRFLQLMPGKVLNYFDYYPGSQYTEFIQNQDLSSAEAVVPPHVMEKWFDLADAVPSFNPMNAQDTGKSLSGLYSSILHESKLLGLESKTKSEKAIYTQAVNYLNGLVPDPENPVMNVSRLTLYERYRDLYNDRKLDMEDAIEEKRTSVGFLEYELWFQRHYPSMQAKVEGAYTRWLIFGDKEKVELYITYMDTGSAGTQLEQGRMALRAAGVTSLDRTRTIYPVSFEPSDWYKYLLPEVPQKPSQDQLRLMYGKVQSKINAISDMINATRDNTQIGGIVTSLSNTFQQSQREAKENTTRFIDTQIQCLSDSATCTDYNDRRRYAIDALKAEAEAFSTYQHAQYFKSPNDYIAFLKQEQAILQSQLNKIEGYITQSSPYLGGLIDSEELAVKNITDSHRDDQWLKFDYDFDTYYENENEETTTKSLQASMKFHILFFSISGSYSYNKNTHDYNQKIASASLKAKGELLRVNIKRPWFKPEIFEIPDLTFKESSAEGGDAFVSPGRHFKEADLYNELSRSDVKYKLPEYTTGFLLARKVELEFTGLDSDTVTSTMSEMSHKSGGGGFFCFHASASETKTKQTSHVQVQRTANGMKIAIPGAQIIGYYTEVLPRFPLTQQ